MTLYLNLMEKDRYNYGIILRLGNNSNFNPLTSHPISIFFFRFTINLILITIPHISAAVGYSVATFDSCEFPTADKCTIIPFGLFSMRQGRSLPRCTRYC